MHLAPLIQDLAIILATAGLVTLIFRKINQPVVLGYIIAGAIVGPYTPPYPLVSDIPSIKVWAELGVIFLMFSLGLEFTFHKLARVGLAAAVTAVVEVASMVAVGYAAGRLLGWGAMDSLFLGGILSISSTTIIIKAFEALGLKTRRFAEIVFGVLIVEDLVAILLLVGLSTVATTQTLFSMELVYSALKLVVVVGSWFLVGYFLIPSFLKYVAKWLDGESLTILSVGLCLVLVVFATYFEYSPALGAFIMGSILAETSDAHRIEKLILPLKDLFAAVFFVSVGMLVDPKILAEYALPIAVITIVTIVGKIISSTAGAVLSGQPLNRAVPIGFSLAQIGEFSFIIATLGATLKVTSEFLYPVAVSVSIITTFTTPYLIRYSESAGGWLEKRMPVSWREALTRYSVWVLHPSPNQAGRQRFGYGLVRFLGCGLLVTLIFGGARYFAVPWLSERGLSLFWSSLLSWALALVLAAPFIWGMITAFRRENSKSAPLVDASVFLIFLSQLVTLVWVGVLSDSFFATSATLLLIGIGTVGLFVIFYRRLEVSYRWFERHFTANLQSQTDGDSEQYLQSLAPWDLHLNKVVVDPNSVLTGRTLKEADIRGRYGLNLVVIRRGGMGIAPPTSDEKLMPGDELLALGTDEQMQEFRRAVETPLPLSTTFRSLSDYTLKHLVIEPDSSLVGQTIRASGIRALLNGLVVGLERGNYRSINPDPSLTLEAGDRLWIVGVHG